MEEGGIATSQNGIKEDGTEDEDQSTSRPTLPQAPVLSPPIEEMVVSTEEAKTTKTAALASSDDQDPIP